MLMPIEVSPVFVPLPVFAGCRWLAASLTYSPNWLILMRKCFSQVLHRMLMMSVLRLHVGHFISMAVLPVAGRCVVLESMLDVPMPAMLGGCVWSIFYYHWDDE